jgi:hypothetical protein
MGLKDVVRRMTSSVEQIDDTRLQNRFAALGLSPMSEARARVVTRVGGEVKRLRIVPRAGNPSLEVLLDDGTGSISIVFTGRRSLGGVHPGRGLVVEGVAHLERGNLVFLNPAYTLMPE